LYSIRGIDLNRDSNIEARPPIVPDESTTISDSVFDYEDKIIYYYSQRHRMIFTSKMDGESTNFHKFNIRFDFYLIF